MIKPEKKLVEASKTNLHGQEMGSGFGYFPTRWGLSAAFGVSMLWKVLGLNSSTT